MAGQRLGYERALSDHLLERAFVDPLQRSLRSCVRVEQRWMAWLAGSGRADEGRRS